MNNLTVIFIGGLTNGKIILEYLQSNKFVDLPLVITHPKNHPVPRYVDISTIFLEGDIKYDLDANMFTKLISSYKPDFIFVAGWSGMISKKLLLIPKLGTIGFHPSKLPNDRGRSVLAWQIEAGYNETALSMFYFNESPDCGDLIAQEKIIIDKSDYINDVLDKVDIASRKLIKSYFPLLMRGAAPRRPQNINEGNYRYLRTDKHSMIDWNNSTISILNKIRAISKPYPGSIGILDDNKYRIWKAESHKKNKFFKEKRIGNCIYDDNNDIIVQCKDGLIKVTDFEEI